MASHIYPRIDVYESLFKEQIINQKEIQKIIRDYINGNCWGMYLEGKNFIPIFNAYMNKEDENDLLFNKEMNLRKSIAENPNELLSKMKEGDRLIMFMAYEVNLIIRITKTKEGFRYEDTDRNLLTNYNKIPLNKQRFRFVSRL